MSWSQDAEGTFSRPMAGAELFFQASSVQGIAQVASTVHASMIVEMENPKPTMEKLTQAVFNSWIQLRANHPLLNVQPKSNPDNHYIFRHQEDSESVHQWAKSTLFMSGLEDGNMDNKIICDKRAEISLNLLPDKDGYAAQLYCFWAKDNVAQDCVKSAGFILRMSHTIIDGPGATTLLSDLRQELANPSPDPARISWSDAAFREEQRRKLPRNAPDLVSHEFNSTQPENIEEKVEQLRLMQRNVELAMPCPMTEAPCPTYHSKVTLTKEQTLKLKKIAQKYNLSVSPLLHAAIIARATIEYAVHWPPKPDELYVAFWPVDSRPGFEISFKRGVLLAMDLSYSIMQVGKRFEQFTNNDVSSHNNNTEGLPYSKEEAERNLSKITLALAEDANPKFLEMRSAEQRAAVTKSQRELFPALGKAIAVGEIPFGKTVIACFSDAVIDRHIINDLPNLKQDGVSTKIVDLDMSTNIRNPWLMMRTWIFQGQTHLCADWTSKFFTKEEAERILNLWKNDVIRLIGETTV